MIPDEKSYLEIRGIQQRENKNINFFREHNIRLKVYPATPDDQRKITKILDKFYQEYCCTKIYEELTQNSKVNP